MNAIEFHAIHFADLMWTVLWTMAKTSLSSALIGGALSFGMNGFNLESSVIQRVCQLLI
jgi:hypothetical protein